MRQVNDLQELLGSGWSFVRIATISGLLSSHDVRKRAGWRYEAARLLDEVLTPT